MRKRKNRPYRARGLACMGTRMLPLKRQDSRLTHHNTPSRPAIYTNTHTFMKTDRYFFPISKNFSTFICNTLTLL